MLLDVSGMMCGGCVALAESVLMLRNGSSDSGSSGDLRTEVEVTADAAKSLTKRVTESGFETKRRASGMGGVEQRVVLVTSPLCRFSRKNLTQMFHLLFGSIVEKTVYMKKLGTAISRSDVVVFVFCKPQLVHPNSSVNISLVHTPRLGTTSSEYSKSFLNLRECVQQVGSVPGCK
ncbi:hypothetical protein YC2023_091841 [Brassica napus]